MQSKACDILIVGGGGAALYAALHAHDANPKLKIIVASKGLFGKSGCTRMVQGGYNVVLHRDDSFDKHYQDTLRGGSLVNDQELAWRLVTEAPERIFELENKYGCFFDRNDDGTIHQRALAGQSFNRTVHRADLTGIELMSRLSEQVLARDIEVLNEVRGIDLLLARDGRTVCGALLYAFMSGEKLVVNARATLLATGGAAPLYRVTAASLEKSGDGLAMAYRAGAEFVDMEMMQFHPTGLIAGKSVMTGTVLEEGLRGAGGHLLNNQGERYMERYDPAKMERSTRDRVSRSGFLEIRAGRGTPQDGVFLDVRHLGKDFLMKSSPGMYKRCLTFGYDMATQLVQVTPTAHFQMGGVRIDTECRSTLEGLFAAGEDAGGVHGANRLGGNGVAESMVFGAVAGDSMAAYASGATLRAPDLERANDSIQHFFSPRKGKVNGFDLRAKLGNVAWESLGVIRSADSLKKASDALEDVEATLPEIDIADSDSANPARHQALDLENLIHVARMIECAASARQESRGSHYREDFTEQNDRDYLVNFYLKRGASGRPAIEQRPVEFTRCSPENLKGEIVIAKTAVTHSASEV